MAGTRGPVPKRSSERRRRNKDSQVETVQPLKAAKVEQPPGNPQWHEIALDWYESLAESGQAQFFEPSDWQYARYVAHAVSLNLKQRKFSAVLFASVTSAMNDLLTTEASRRRVRMEIDRVTGDAEPAAVTAIADYRQRLGGKTS